MLYELIYSSNATHEIENRTLESILGEARRNNKASGVTGLLIFDGASFCQLIEGKKEAIENTFARIKSDNRHSSVSVFHSGPIERRSFGEWAMSYKWVESHLPRDGWKNWLEGQMMINAATDVETTGRRILKFVNNLS